MHTSNLNQMAKELVQQYGLEHPIETRFIDLASEVGELGKELLKSSNYGKNPCQSSESIVNEIGDVLFSLACIANTLDIDMAEAMSAAINKYHARFSKTGDIGSG